MFSVPFFSCKEKCLSSQVKSESLNVFGLVESGKRKENDNISCRNDIYFLQKRKWKYFLQNCYLFTYGQVSFCMPPGGGAAVRPGVDYVGGPGFSSHGGSFCFHFLHFLSNQTQVKCIIKRRKTLYFMHEWWNFVIVVRLL